MVGERIDDAMTSVQIARQDLGAIVELLHPDERDALARKVEQTTSRLGELDAMLEQIGFGVLDPVAHARWRKEVRAMRPADGSAPFYATALESGPDSP